MAATLTPQQNELVRSAYDLGLTVTEASERLDIGPVAIRNRFREWDREKEQAVTPAEKPPEPSPQAPTLDEAAERIARNREIKMERDALMAVAGEKSLRAHLEAIIRDVVPRMDPMEPLPRPEPSPWASRETMLTVWSDWHAFETVTLDRTMGFNEFTAKILGERLRRDVLARLDIKDRLERGGGWSIPHQVIALNGDLISGTIHELERHSEGNNVVQSCYYTARLLAAAVGDMAPHFEWIDIYCTSGNHGRLPDARRMQQKDPTRNWDTVIYLMAMEMLSRLPNVRFHIPDSYFALYQIEGWQFLQTHGHDIKSWNSIPYYGIDRFGRNVQALHAARKERIDYFIISHFHSAGAIPAAGGETIVNGCFPAGTPIAMVGGARPIEDVRKNDLIVSRDGSIQHVVNTLERPAPEGLVEIGIKGFSRPLRATPNHLVWAIKGDTTKCVCKTHALGRMEPPADTPSWIPIGMLSAWDWVNVPSLKAGSFRVDPELAWALGLYVAEGHTIVDGGSSKRHNRIEFTMHIDEASVLERAEAVLRGYIGKPGRLSKRPGKTTSHLTFSVDRDYAAEWRDRFGHGARNKIVPAAAYYWTQDARAAFVRGWRDGDGHEHTAKDGNVLASATTISPQLAWGMFLLANSEGEHPTLKRLGKGGRRKNDSYTVMFNSGQDSLWINGERFVRICHRRRIAEPTTVYDLETTGEHSFVANGVGVHNSLIGGNEFSVGALGKADKPTQWMFLVHEEFGLTSRWPVYGVGSKAVEPYPIPEWNSVA